MDTRTIQSKTGHDAGLNSEQAALLDALADILTPLAQLCIGKGLTVPMVEQRLRDAFVQTARAQHSDLPGQRLTSRISASTGLTRRHVAQLEGIAPAQRELRRSPVTEMFTRWLSDPALRGPLNEPMPLKRQGPAPSFEALAQSVTRDVHPRTLLEELSRLKLARLDPTTDTVTLLRSAFVPSGDWTRMVGFLGDNVGDHLRAAAANVLGDGKAHFEQAIFADELSEQSLAAVRDLITQHWRGMLEQIAPRLEHLIESDRSSGRTQDRSVRIGLFTWSQAMPQSLNHSPHATRSTQDEN